MKIDRQEKKLDNWKGVSGIYILRGDGNYEITPHPLQKEREENERLNNEKENKNKTESYNYWGTITTNMIDENKKRNNTSKSEIVFKYPSKQKDKKLTKKQKQLKIDITHRKSGFYKQNIKFVSGGLPSLGKKR